MSRPQPPAKIARQLRQESGFGCAECGNPIIEYHHIVEWSELNHFDPNHMVALCPTCHAEFGKLSPKKSYAVKDNPINIRTGRTKGYLGGNKNQKALRVGGMTVENCNSAVNYSGIDIFSYKFSGEEYLLNALLLNEKFWPEVQIKNNELTASICPFWDIEFKTNWVKFRRSKGDIFLSVDFRGDFVEIDGNLDIGGTTISLKSGLTKNDSLSIKSMHFSNCEVGMAIGPKGRILGPNFAMMQPQALYIPGK